MDDLGKLLKVRHGGYEFPIESVVHRERPSRDERGAVVGYTRSFIIQGEVRGADLAAVTQARRDLWAALIRPPQRLDVIALDSQLTNYMDPAEIAASGGVGPFLADLDWQESGPTFARFAMTMFASWQYPGDATQPQTPTFEQETIELTVDVDSRQFITRRGRIQGTGASTLFSGRLPPPSPTYRVRYETSRNEGNSDLTYRIEVIPLISALPVNCDDGELQTERFFDGLAITTRRIGHYVGTGAVAASIVQENPPSGAALIIGRRAETTHGQRRVDFTHEFLQPAPQSAGAIGWSETTRFGVAPYTVRAIEYPGTAPLLIVNRNPLFATEHSGRAVALDGFPAYPFSEFGQNLQFADGDAAHEWVDARRRATSWRYSQLFTTPQLGVTPPGPR